MQDMGILSEDLARYKNIKEMPRYQRYFRKYQDSSCKIIRLFYKIIFTHYRNKCLVDISADTKIGGGLYIGHPYCITINPQAVIGRNCNIHKGVTIGQENRGFRKGVPVINDEVWIGINATIVGAINIGSDVLIAPNSYVNCDVPDHSVVFGNPCIIKHKENATQGYINNKFV